MKKLILSMVAVLTIGFASAQSREKGTIELTPQVGYSSFIITGDNSEDLEFKSGVRFGVSGDYYFNSTWSLRSGLISESMGTRVPGQETKLNYLTVPVNANWHFGSTKKWNLNFGVTPSFLTSAESAGFDIKDNLKSFQLGFSYGIGYKIEVTPNIGILIDFQGFSGLSNINDSSEFNNKNAGSSFNVGGVFKL